MCPILFYVGAVPVRAYELLVCLGYLTGAAWLWTQRGNMRFDGARFWALAASIFAAAILGGKAGYFLVERRDFLADPWEMLRDWKTGWVFWGGLTATIMAGWVFQRAYNGLYRPRAYLPVADYFGAALPMGHWIGRLGCFLKGCCYGRLTALPWGVRFTSSASDVEEALLGVWLHPTQLYEAAGELALCLFLVFHVLPRIRRGRYAYGTAFLGYIVLYSILRFIVESFRGDDRGAFLSPALSPSQWFSLAALLIAGAMLYRQGVIERRPKTRSMYLR